MKKKKFALAVIAILALIVLLVTGFTVSRYSQTITGGFDFKVAPWVFNVTTENGKPISEIKFVAEDGSLAKPGTNGKFKIIIDARGSGVDISYTTALVEKKLPANMKFYLVQAPEYVYDDINEIIKNMNGTFRVGSAQKKEYSICWKWPKEGKDDTTEATPDSSYGINLSVTAKQV